MDTDEAKKYLPNDIIEGTVTKGRYKIVIRRMDQWQQLEPHIEKTLIALIDAKKA